MTRYAPQYLQADSYAASQDRRTFQALYPAAASVGLAVTVSAAMTVNIAPGQVAIPTPNNTGSTLCTSDNIENVTLAAAPASGTNRIDLVVAQARGNDLDGGSNNDFVFAAVTGTAAASPAVPATPAGTVALAQIYVHGAEASIAAGDITDTRPHGIGLEVPLAAGAPIAAFTDPWGEVWVAKGGVNGGAWRKARDVLKSLVARNAAMNLGTATGTIFVWDTVSYDPYGLYNPANGIWTVPVAGRWRLTAKVQASSTGAGQSISLYAANQTLTGGYTIMVGAISTASGQGVMALISELIAPALGDLVRVNALGTVAMGIQTPAFGLTPCTASLEYVGTG